MNSNVGFTIFGTVYGFESKTFGLLSEVEGINNHLDLDPNFSPKKSQGELLKVEKIVQGNQYITLICLYKFALRSSGSYRGGEHIGCGIGIDGLISEQNISLLLDTLHSLIAEARCNCDDKFRFHQSFDITNFESPSTEYKLGLISPEPHIYTHLFDDKDELPSCLVKLDDTDLTPLNIINSIFNEVICAEFQVIYLGWIKDLTTRILEINIQEIPKLSNKILLEKEANRSKSLYNEINRYKRELKRIIEVQEVIKERSYNKINSLEKKIANLELSKSSLEKEIFNHKSSTNKSDSPPSFPERSRRLTLTESSIESPIQKQNENAENFFSIKTKTRPSLKLNTLLSVAILILGTIIIVVSILLLSLPKNTTPTSTPHESKNSIQTTERTNHANQATETKSSLLSLVEDEGNYYKKLTDEGEFENSKKLCVSLIEDEELNRPSDLRRCFELYKPCVYNIANETKLKQCLTACNTLSGDEQALCVSGKQRDLETQMKKQQEND